MAQRDPAESLRRSRAELLDSLEQAVIATDLDGTITYWNPFAERVYGWTAAEVLGRNIEDVTPSDLSREQASDIMERLRSGTSWAGEFEVRRRDGSRFPAHVTDTPIRDDHGQLVGIVGVSFDLTETRRIQDALATALQREQAAAARASESLALLDVLVSNAPTGIAFLDRELRYARVNQQIADATGVPMEAHIGRSVREIVPDMAAQIEGPLRQVLETGRPLSDLLVRGQTRSAPGVERAWRVSLYPVPGAGGQIVGVGVVAAEITDQMRLEAEREQLLASERHLRAEAEAQRSRLREVLDVLPEGVIIADRATCRFTLTNRASVEVIGMDLVGADVPLGAEPGYGSRQFDGTPIPADDLPLQRALRGESVIGAQYMHRHVANDRDVPLLVNSAPLHDTSGGVVGALCVFQDISAIRDLEEQKDEFLAGVSHDLQQPLAIIKGRAQLLRRRLSRGDTLDAEGVGEGLAIIQTTVDDMAATLTDLLDATRLQMGRPLELQRATVDLVEFARQIVSGWDEVSAGQRIDLETSLEQLPALIDAQRLRRVIGNLLSNAVKYNRADAPIIVRVRVKEGAAEGAEAVVEVEDRGVGIPAGDLPRIFERFYRARNAGGAVGAGIGLAGARQIVAQHGGTIVAHSREGDGSTFSVRIPL